jgi:hypothetical protein
VTAASRTRAPASARLAAVLLLLLATVLTVAPTAHAQDADDRGDTHASAVLTITGISGIVGPGSVPPDQVASAPRDLSLRLLVTNDGDTPLTNLRVVVETYASVGSRSVLREALDRGEVERRLIDVADSDVRDGGVLAPGDVAGRELTVSGSEIGWDGHGGVFPVKVSVLRGSEVLDRATTAVVHLADPPVGTLETVVVWPIDTPPWRGPDGVYAAGVDEPIQAGGRLDRLLAALEARPNAAVHLAPAAHLLEDLQDRSDGFPESVPGAGGTEIRDVPADDPAAERASRTLERIRDLVATLPVPPVAGPYADAAVAGLVAAPAPLAQDAATVVSEGRRRIQRVAGRAPDPAAYLATTPLTREALEVVPGEHLLLPWGFIDGPDLASNPDLPTALRSVTAGSGRRFTATVADPRIEALLVEPDVSHGPLLATQRVVAETAMIFFAAPSMTGRPLLVLPPVDWSPHPRLPAPLLAALVDAPWLDLTTPLEQLGAAASALPRLTFDEEALAGLPATLATELIAAQRQLEAVRSALPRGNADIAGRSYGELHDQLLRVPSMWFRGGELDRAAALVRDVRAAVDRAFGTVEVPSSANITLPSDTGSIPVTLQRPTGGPLRVCVEVDSPGRLAWPDGDRNCGVTLTGEGSQTVSFDTRALSRGRSPVTVKVTDPTGTRQLGEATLTVNSTAISTPALIVTGGVVLGLVLWGSVRRRRPPRPKLEVVGEHMTDQTGGIITGWLLQLVVVMSVLGLIGYEAITVAITSINLDDDARAVAIQARDAYRADNDLRAAEAAAETAAERVEVELVSVDADDDNVYATVAGTADTLLLHRIEALDSVTAPTARGRARWRP